MKRKTTRSAESLSPGNAIATLIDKRNDAIKVLEHARYDKMEAERMIVHKIMKDPVGLEGVMKIDWPKLYRLFGV